MQPDEIECFDGYDDDESDSDSESVLELSGEITMVSSAADATIS